MNASNILYGRRTGALRTRRDAGRWKKSEIGEGVQVVFLQTRYTTTLPHSTLHGTMMQ
jgi:hypothetical protein